MSSLIVVYLYFVVPLSRSHSFFRNSFLNLLIIPVYLNSLIYLQLSLTYIYLVCYVHPDFCVYHLPHFMVYPLYRYTSFSISSSSSNLPVKSIYLFLDLLQNEPTLFHSFINLPVIPIYLILFMYPVFCAYHLPHFIVYPLYQYTLFSISSSSSKLPVKSIYFFPWSISK